MICVGSFSHAASCAPELPRSRTLQRKLSFPFDLPAGTPVKRLDTIGFLLLLDAACQDMAGTRQPVADSGHFDRLDILRLWL
jgi:hypothetical protein